jgi:tRNA threonylcarbamoyl adenosine modification protein YjeE
VLCHIYEGTSRLFHVDAYRLKDAAEFEALGVLEQIANREGILVIEWGEKIAEALPSGRIDVVIVETGPETRLIEIDLSAARPELRSAVRRLLGAM